MSCTSTRDRAHGHSACDLRRYTRGGSYVFIGYKRGGAWLCPSAPAGTCLRCAGTKEPITSVDVWECGNTEPATPTPKNYDEKILPDLSVGHGGTKKYLVCRRDAKEKPVRAIRLKFFREVRIFARKSRNPRNSTRSRTQDYHGAPDIGGDWIGCNSDVQRGCGGTVWMYVYFMR